MSQDNFGNEIHVGLEGIDRLLRYGAVLRIETGDYAFVSIITDVWGDDSSPLAVVSKPGKGNGWKAKLRMIGLFPTVAEALNVAIAEAQKQMEAQR